MTIKRLTHVGFAVDDVLAAVAFYKKAFGIGLSFITPDNGYAELDSGPVPISLVDAAFLSEFHPIIRSDPHGDAQAASLSLDSDDPDADFAHAVANGATAVTEPHDAEWGRTAFVRDNNGFIIEIVRSTTGR